MNNINNATTLEQVKAFMIVFSQGIQDKPKPTHDAALGLFRCNLLSEELHELEAGVMFEDKLETFDALLDLQYVLDGAFLALGYHKIKDEGFRIVHESNMSKLGPDGRPMFNAAGKVMKPASFVPPTERLRKLLEDLENGQIP